MGVHTAWGMVCAGGGGRESGGGVPFFQLRLHSADSILQRKTEMMRLLKVKARREGRGVGVGVWRGVGGGRRRGVKCEGRDGKSQFALSQSGPPCCRTNVATDCTQRVISYGSYTAVFL